MRYLRLGSKGPDVLAWETFLVGLNPDSKVIVDDKFDAVTFEETKAFQRHVGVEVDGVVGSLTYGKAAALGFKLAEDYDAPPNEQNSPNWPRMPVFGPLSYGEREKVFGKFSYVAAPVPGNPEAIKITDGWATKNIVSVNVPQLKGVSGAPASCNVQFHRLASKQLVDMFAAWEAAGLKDRILTWGGSWVPRFVRGSRTSLSNHSFGTAFDINVAWNGLGVTPALKGKKGSVRELVQIAHEHGFYWGGHFKSRPDGMHFETCKIL